MDRRRFLQLFGLGAAATAASAVAGVTITALDPEKALWIPGAKTFFLPPGDIAIKNIRVATDAEVAQVTKSDHMLRIKYWDRLGHTREAGIEKIALVSELAFAKNGKMMFPDGYREMHLDTGQVFYPGMSQRLHPGAEQVDFLPKDQFDLPAIKEALAKEQAALVKARELERARYGRFANRSDVMQLHILTQGQISVEEKDAPKQGVIIGE